MPRREVERHDQRNNSVDLLTALLLRRFRLSAAPARSTRSLLDRTLYSAIAREILKKGKAARFKKVEKGKVALSTYTDQCRQSSVPAAGAAIGARKSG